jgi:hypothetical protein
MVEKGYDALKYESLLWEGFRNYLVLRPLNFAISCFDSYPYPVFFRNVTHGS